MPPGKAEKLTEAEVATLKAWIAAGSPADGVAERGGSSDSEPVHWAFRPPKRPEVAP